MFFSLDKPPVPRGRPLSDVPLFSLSFLACHPEHRRRGRLSCYLCVLFLGYHLTSTIATAAIEQLFMVDHRPNFPYFASLLLSFHPLHLRRGNFLATRGDLTRQTGSSVVVVCI